MMFFLDAQPSLISTAFRVLFTVLAVLSVGAVVLTIGHRFLKRRVQMSMQQHSDTLVGQKAMVVEDLRPRGIGSIRAMLTPEEEAARSMKREQADDPLKIFPAVADQYISKGRIVRVTGGDRTMYRVRPIRW
ncbi:MAG: hypothetical protein GX910_03745 [Clostridiaceae bacterium]|jgi:membrane-bound ClpP family serine protease|nr:hypothetical protein [Clostridiaceae bacterium]